MFSCIQLENLLLHKVKYDVVLDELFMEVSGSKLFIAPSDYEILYCPKRHLNWKSNGYNFVRSERQIFRSHTI